MKQLTLKSGVRFVICISLIALFFACNKTLDPIAPIPNPSGTTPDLTTTVNSSVSGYVTDQNETAVLNATVQVGSTTTTTDKYGFFQALNVQVVQNAAVVTIGKPGYFKTYKTYIAEAGKPTVLRIKLIPKTISGNINGNTGGVITLPNNTSITYPANALINAASGVAYTGSASISAYWIDPTGADLNRIMPGDLRGLNTQGNLQLLTTYGMVAVEMNGSGGELLQIATGKKATLSIPIPFSIAGSAPASIPLWYFEEAKGLWKQEGVATKTGNNYVGDVSHFSFWNYDAPSNYVQFNCTVVTANGQPVPYVVVKISVVNNPWNYANGYTNTTGYLNGAVPANQQLLLEVFNSSTCGIPVFTQTFTTTNVNVSFGTITVPAAVVTTINGTVLNCANLPVTNGFIILQIGFSFAKYALSNTGTYSVVQLACNGLNNVTLIGEDVTAAQQSNAAVYPIMPGLNAIPTFQACGVSTTQFFNYVVNGTPVNYSVPPDTINLGGGGTNNSYSVDAKRSPFSQATVSNISFTTAGIAVGSVQNLLSFSMPAIPPNSTIGTPIGVNITELGSIGQFIAGNFAGTITGPGPTNTPYNITGNFRVKRTF